MAAPRIIGVMILRNGISLGYPFELAIKSLQALCDAVLVAVDPTSDDDTVAAVKRLGVFTIESIWDTENHKGFDSSGVTPKADVADEITRQTRIVVGSAREWICQSHDWIFSLQADEILHTGGRDIEYLRDAVRRAEAGRYTGITLPRLYFFGRLDKLRDSWTMPLLRLFRPDCWVPDEMSGAMSFVPVGRQGSFDMGGVAQIYHYSRMGDPLLIAKRVRNLDTFYHPPEKLVAEADLAPYTFELRNHDCAAIKGATSVLDPTERLVAFDVSRHPPGVADFYKDCT